MQLVVAPLDEKMIAKSILSLHRFLKRGLLSTLFSLLHLRNAHATHVKLQNQLQPGGLPPIADTETVVIDLEGALLMSPSTFPYFMLVAMEAGGFLRAFVLLLLYPLIWFVDEEVGIKVMAFVSFFGIRRDGLRVGRAVLPKHLLEDVGVEGWEVVVGGGGGRRRRRVVCVSSMPSVMVEGFVKEYLGLEEVVGRELKVVGGYFTGLMEENKAKEEAAAAELLGGGGGPGGEGESSGVVGIIGSSRLKCYQHPFFSKCKEIYTVNESERRSWHPLPREKHPKPLIFHDGRLAFRPTPSSTLAMFLWLPFGFLLALLRAIAFLTLPYSLSTPLLAILGMKSRLVASPSSPTASRRNRLFVCNHRTLLDPLYLSAALQKNVTAMTYSLSRVSEFLSPIRTVRLTRDREEDKRRMESHLRQGDLVVCPEGTTCREPFLLRFSPLFAELNDELVPVAVESEVTMFYGTTAGGFKCLDPLFFLMNPSPSYKVEFLERIEMGNGRCSNGRYEMANLVQGVVGEALGYKCTSLTRKDKYLMLAGNEGFVR